MTFQITDLGPADGSPAGPAREPGDLLEWQTSTGEIRRYLVVRTDVQSDGRTIKYTVIVDPADV